MQQYFCNAVQYKGFIRSEGGVDDYTVESVEHENQSLHLETYKSTHSTRSI